MKITSFPLVSVIIPAHNGSKTIERALRGVFGQTYTNCEIIVVDDGSTDLTLDILGRYKPTIRVMTQMNLGCTSARQHGCEQAKGEYVAFLDQDDWWAPEKLSIQVEVLQRQPQVGLTFCNLEAVGEEGKSLGFVVVPPEYCHAPSLEEMLLMFPIYPSAALIRKNLVHEIGGLDTRFGFSGGFGDFDFHLRLRELTEFHCTDKCLGYYYYDYHKPGRAEMVLANLPIWAGKYWNHSYLLDPQNYAARQTFVQRCCDKLRQHMEILLRRHGNIASVELLGQFNYYHQRLSNIFGQEYPKVTGLNSLDLSKFPPDSASCTLLFLYLWRSDLQREFIEVQQGDLRRIVDWATKVASGALADPHYDILRQFVTRFEGQTSAIVPSESELQTSSEGAGVLAHRTQQGALKAVVSASLRMISEKGLGAFCKAALRKIGRRDFTIRGSL